MECIWELCEYPISSHSSMKISDGISFEHLVLQVDMEALKMFWQVYNKRKQIMIYLYREATKKKK